MWNHTNRNFGLDVLRAAAILLVLISHCTFLYPKFNPQLTDGIRLLGATGVDLFFVLSGYLIGGLIIKNLESGKVYLKDLIHFWKRRWLRTLPNYFTVLFLNILLLFVLGDAFISEYWLFIPFLQNFSTAHPDFFTEAWSLSIEEYAYILLPALIYLVTSFFKTNKPLKVFLFTTLIVILGLFTFKFSYYFIQDVSSYKDWSSSFRKVVIYRLDAIYYGFIAVYFISKYSFFKRLKTVLLFLGILIFVILHFIIVSFNISPTQFKLFYSVLYLPLISISIILVFPWFIELKAKSVITLIISYVSSRSYAIYLVNYSLVLLTIQRFINPSVFAVGIYLVLTLIFSELLYKIVERPVLKYRDKMVPR